MPSALDVGILAESREMAFYTYQGLDGLVRAFIDERDVERPDEEAGAFDAAAFHKAAGEFIRAARAVKGDSRGALWLLRLCVTLTRVQSATDPLVPLRAILNDLERRPRTPTKRGDFGGDDVAWTLWKRFMDGDKGSTPLCSTGTFTVMG